MVEYEHLTVTLSYDAVPCGAVLLVEFFLKKRGHIFLHVELFHGLDEHRPKIGGRSGFARTGGYIPTVSFIAVSISSRGLVHPFVLVHARSTHRQGTFHGILLHVFGHVGVDDRGLELRSTFCTHGADWSIKQDLSEVSQRCARRPKCRRSACDLPSLLPSVPDERERNRNRLR